MKFLLSVLAIHLIVEVIANKIKVIKENRNLDRK
jgi:hypothetical protein